MGNPLSVPHMGGLAEVVPEKTGLFCPVDDSVGMATQIVALLSDPGRYYQMHTAARAHSGRYGWQAVASQSDAVYSRDFAENQYSCPPRESP